MVTIDLLIDIFGPWLLGSGIGRANLVAKIVTTQNHIFFLFAMVTRRGPNYRSFSELAFSESLAVPPNGREHREYDYYGSRGFEPLFFLKPRPYVRSQYLEVMWHTGAVAPMLINWFP